MPVVTTKPDPPTDDKRWRIVDAAMRRNGYEANGLIETLHAVQQTFGFLEESSMNYVAQSLRAPLSKVYGVATFYHFFSLKPQGRHVCVVCLGTACYIRKAARLLEEMEKSYTIRPGETTDDGNLSLMIARCIGSCGLAPACILDGDVLPQMTPELLAEKVKGVCDHDS